MTEKSKPENQTDVPAADTGAIVAIGASAGGVSALKSFFGNISPDWPFCYVVIQHLSSEHKSQMKDILMKCTSLDIKEVSEGLKFEKGHIYLIPPGKLLQISAQRKFEVSSRPERPDINKAIDHFFLSLAKALKHKAIGVILSGTGSDGMEGVMAIKETEGFVVVQTPDQAEFDGMPLSAINSIEPDDVLPVEKIPNRIFDYFESHLYSSTQFNSIAEKGIFDQIIKFIGNLEKVDFHKYKEGTLYRRIKRRMEVTEMKNLEDYYYHLKKTPTECSLLFEEFFIGVTEFFRDPSSWTSLRQLALSEMIKEKIKKKEQLKVWCIGCCTGEEVYSLGIYIREEINHLDAQLEVKIFASDIKKDYISKASQGVYSKDALSQVPQKYLSRYFSQKDDLYKIRREVRDMIIFSKHDVTSDTPFINSKLVTDGVVISFINVTDLKHAELELQQSNEKFRSIVEGTKAYITIIDLKGKVLYSNNVLEVYELDTFIGSNLYQRADGIFSDRPGR